MKFIKILLISLIVPALFFSIAAKADQSDCVEGNIDSTGCKLAASGINNTQDPADKARASSIVEKAHKLYRDLTISQALIIRHPSKFSAARDIHNKAEAVIIALDTANEQGTLTSDQANKSLNDIVELNQAMMNLFNEEHE